jgi:TRAP-type C4-dicarboxylate transport system permease small subunit
MFKRIEHLLDTLGAIAILALCILIVATIFTREVFGFGLPDSIVLVRELMVPAILFPLCAATSRRSHIAIEVISNHFPDGLNRWIAVLAALIGILVVGALIAAGWMQFTKTWAQGSHYSGDFSIPKWPSRALYTLAFAFVFLRLVQQFWVDLKAAMSGQPAPDVL